MWLGCEKTTTTHQHESEVLLIVAADNNYFAVFINMADVLLSLKLNVALYVFGMVCFFTTN